MEQTQDIVLGLDISTTTIGICLMLNDGSDYGKIIELTHINPKVPSKTDKNEALFLKAEIFKNEFIKKYQHYNITKVVIEAPLLRSNNINTVGTLLRFNGIISLIIYEELGVVPDYISSYDARKFGFPDLMAIRKFDKNGNEYPKTKIISAVNKGQFVLFGGFPWDIDKKTIVQSRVADLFPDIVWLYDKKGELKKENFDATDAWVACIGYLNREKYGELEYKVSNVSSNAQQIEYDVEYWNKKETKKIIF